MSRTRLAERFRHLLGESPIAYLAQWRLTLGAEALQSTQDSVAEVAAAVGYHSEAAFNRAFKSQFHSPPAQFGRLQREANKPASSNSGQVTSALATLDEHFSCFSDSFLRLIY